MSPDALARHVPERISRRIFSLKEATCGFYLNLGWVSQNNIPLPQIILDRLAERVSN